MTEEQEPAPASPPEPMTRRARLHPDPPAASRRAVMGALAGGTVAVVGGGVYAAAQGLDDAAPSARATLGKATPTPTGPSATNTPMPTGATATKSPTPTATKRPTPPSTNPSAPAPAVAPPARVQDYPATGQGVAGGTPPPLSRVTPSQAPTVLTLDPTAHLVRRTTWGVTSADLTSAASLGRSAWLTRQLSTTAPSEPVLAPVLTALTTLGRTSAQVRAMTEPQEDDDYFLAHGELELAAIARAMWSKRQLYELLVDFFHSRVHVPVYTDKSRFTLTNYDAAVVRKYALGRYSDMVWASVTHPAMLSYLDNVKNTKRGGNQNLGRELLELHTVGVDAGYTQDDVDGAALLLTGVGVDDATLTMTYTPADHATGAVTVMGVRYPNASAADGLSTLRALVTNLTHSRHTAYSLAADLARRFVSDTPPASLVVRLASIYLNNDTAIVPMVRALFGSAEYAASVGAKYRRPLEAFVASARALGIAPDGPVADTLDGLNWMRWEMYTLGQNPLGHNAPDGHPDFARPWLSTAGTLGRWNLDMVLSGGWPAGFGSPAVDGWLAPVTTFGAAVDAIATAVIHQSLSAPMRAALLDFLGHAAGDRLSTSEKGWNYDLRVRLPALILSGPHMQVR